MAKSFCFLLLLLLLPSIFLFTSVARPLNEAKPASGSSVTKGIEILLDDLSLATASALGGIKTGGPSSGGNGHAFVDAVTNSGPSSGGDGHAFTNSGPSSGGDGH
ncbi:hypothetical protein V6N13_087517 [Hibiscus sabdariffa]|uniref:Uncharacterized protein n=1 Tax=Hibiscus sabdariffa TaxID=183260 RepID=A0ABR2FWX0_9ROSI